MIKTGHEFNASNIVVRNVPVSCVIGGWYESAIVGERYWIRCCRNGEYENNWFYAHFCSIFDTEDDIFDTKFKVLIQNNTLKNRSKWYKIFNSHEIFSQWKIDWHQNHPKKALLFIQHAIHCRRDETNIPTLYLIHRLKSNHYMFTNWCIKFLFSYL